LMSGITAALPCAGDYRCHLVGILRRAFGVGRSDIWPATLHPENADIVGTNHTVVHVGLHRARALEHW
jgi:hypothetical protein